MTRCTNYDKDKKKHTSGKGYKTLPELKIYKTLFHQLKRMHLKKKNFSFTYHIKLQILCLILKTSMSNTRTENNTYG